MTRSSEGARRRLAPAAALGLALLTPACGRGRPDDPLLGAVGRILRPGERLALFRPFGPETGERFVAVVRTAGGKTELRVYERRAAPGDYAVAYAEQQGDLFHNLVLEDVDADGQEDIVATWTGGHLEILDVIARDQGGAYRSLFQNAGQQIERHFGPDGAVEFWITSRTYRESPGQAPTYETLVFRWNGTRFSEAPKR